MSENTHKHDHEEHDSHDDHHGHGHDHGHSHNHGTIDISALSNERGKWAVKWSFIWLSVTAVFQLGVVFYSGSVALLADTVHNLGDAMTAVPLWIAFTLARRKPTKRFTHGYGRVEDLAGITIVLIILFSALFASYESINRFFHPQKMEHLWIVGIAAAVGFFGNELVALFRLKVGKEIGSAALIADGYHARVDGYTSLAVLLGVIGTALGFPLADPIIGCCIAVMILGIVWDSAKAVFMRVLDGIDPEIVDEVCHSARHVDGVKDVTEVRVRWIGHRLHAELNVTVENKLTVEEGHQISVEVRHQLLHHLKYLSNATIHIDPLSHSGEQYHAIDKHHHGDHPEHSHG